MTYNDETDRNYVCLIDQGTTCRHFNCVFKDVLACGATNGYNSASPDYRTCLKPAGHSAFHQNHDRLWPAVDEHACPEPTLLIVNEGLVRNLQGMVDDLTTAKGTANAYETLRVILDKMEKGFRVPE